MRTSLPDMRVHVGRTGKRQCSYNLRGCLYESWYGEVVQ